MKLQVQATEKLGSGLLLPWHDLEADDAAGCAMLVISCRRVWCLVCVGRQAGNRNSVRACARAGPAAMDVEAKELR